MKRSFFGHRHGALRATIVVAGALAAGGLVVGNAMAQDRADLDRSQIIGNRELPKVIYIVPWKKPAPGDLSSRPLESVLDEALAPVDRDVFRRQVRYDAVIQSRAAPNGPATPATDRK
jgi:hypothetical protein